MPLNAVTQNRVPPARQAGFTMIEVLVAFFILAIGLMGLSALLTTSVQANQGSYYRSQAVYLAEDMADRIRANREVDYTGLTAFSSAVCFGTDCSATQMARSDLKDWEDTVGNTLAGAETMICVDSTPQDGENAASAECDGSGSLVAIKIWWDSNRDGTVDANDTRVVTVVN